MNIPSLPVENFIDPNTNDLNPNWRIFLDQLVSVLQQNASNEGLVAPSQSTADIAIIAANQLQNSSYTTQGGTLIYDSTTDLLKVAILVANVPTFKTVTVT